MEDKFISDFRITWRYCSHINDINESISKISDLTFKKLISFAFDSNMKLYRLQDEKLVVDEFDLVCDYENPSGTIKYKEDVKLNLQEEHYLYEIAGTKVHRNMMFKYLEDEYTLFFVLEPMYFLFVSTRLCLYPIVKVTENMIMLEYRVFPKDEKICQKDFLDTYTSIFRKKIDALQVDINFFKFLFKDKKPEHIVNTEHDGCEQVICDMPLDAFGYLSDFSMNVLNLFSGCMNEWYARITYSVDTNGNDNDFLNRLAFDLPSGTKFQAAYKFINYREFNDYKHYVMAGSSITLGKIELSYSFADALDEEILFASTKISMFRNMIKTNRSNAKKLIDIYEKIVEYKSLYLNRYKSIFSVHKIMNYIWEENRAQESIDTLKELIDINLKRVEAQKIDRVNKIQAYLAILSAVLSSAPVYEYLVLPYVGILMSLDINMLNQKIRMITYACTLSVIVLLVLLFTYILHLRSKKQDGKTEKGERGRGTDD